MDTSSPPRSQNALLASVLSLLIPGAGQLYLRKHQRGLAILAGVLVLAYLINWTLKNFALEEIASWLWLLFALFWAWNILDAYRLARGQTTYNRLGLLLAIVIIYVIGWCVTDINLDRLVTRFQDVQVVFRALVYPDLFTQEGGTWQPSENFGDIIGKVVDRPAPDWLVQLGLAQKGAKVPTPVPGKMAETIAIGLMATFLAIILAIPLSFFAAHNIMSRVPGGTVIYYAMRTFLNVVRSVDTIIWGLIIVVWVGLGSFAGTLALTIHSVAALGKLYSEEVEHIDPGPIEAITATGANLLQIIRYAVIPQIVPPFLAYTLLRWDINMRMATVVGFVAGGGIGFFVIETIRKGGYEQYAAALWVVAIVIIVVDYVSAKWRARILTGEDKVSAEAPKPFYTSLRALVWLAVLLLVFVLCWQLSEIDPRKLFEPAPTFVKVVRDFVTIDLSPDVFDTVLKQMLITIFQALLATTLGGLVAVPFSFLAARNLMGGNALSLVLYYLARGALNVLRSIEALLYVAIFVFWVGIGPFAGMLALAITTFALIGKLFSEAIENIDPGPLEAVAATGATGLQTIVYAILPQIIPPFISYLIYQWDINIRIATIVGFAGGGGVGLLLNTYFGMLQYHKAGTVVVAIVIVVAIMDFASAKIRERLV
ncbi:MAG: phosphonate ABC transporter, permease protein PhnE [Chloroflexi bacterium]|nr:phosphonate ABC transporter, permease protein PhnE [Chloroflexota bacterium]